MTTLWTMLKSEKKYWMVPLIVGGVILLLVVLLTDVAPVTSPFRYTTF